VKLEHIRIESRNCALPRPPIRNPQSAIRN
jgi:hypothetical protein